MGTRCFVVTEYALSAPPPHTEKGWGRKPLLFTVIAVLLVAHIGAVSYSESYNTLSLGMRLF